jgi:cell division protein FtsQ
MWPVSTKTQKKPGGGARGAGKSRAPAAKARGASKAGPSPQREAVIRFLSFLILLPIGIAVFYSVFKGGAVSRLGSAMGMHVEEASAKAGFALTRITVNGRQATSEREIAKALGAVRGRSIFAFDCEAARQRLLAIDRIAEADVRRLLPGTIHVELIERKPLAIWQHDGKLTLVDASGHVIDDVSPAELDKFPHVVGEGAERNAAALLDVLDRFPNIESRVRAAVRVGDRRWNLQLSNGIEVWLPADGIETALGELIRLDHEQGILTREIETIDMRFKDRWILRVPTGATEIRPGPSRNT